MSDDGLMVSPIEPYIDVQMTDGHAVDANTVSSKPGEKTSSNTSQTTGLSKQKSPESGVPEGQTTSQPTQPTTQPEDGPVIPTTRVTSATPAMFVPLPLDEDMTQPYVPPRGRVERAKAMLETLEYYRTGVREGFMYLADMDRQFITRAVTEREKVLAEKRAARQAEKEAAVKEKANTSAKPTEAARTTTTAPAAKPATNAPVESSFSGRAIPAKKPTLERNSSSNSRDNSKSASPSGDNSNPNSTGVDIDIDNDDETITGNEVDAMIAAMSAPAVPGVDYDMASKFDPNQPLPPIQFPPMIGEVPGGRRTAVRQLNEVVEQALMQMSGFDAHIDLLKAQWTDNLEREKKLLDERYGSLTEARAALAAEEGTTGAAVGQKDKESRDVTMSGT